MARTLNQSIDIFFRQFAKEFIRSRARQIRKRDLINSETLLKSLYAKVTTDPEVGVFFMTVFASGHGRYHDMARTYTKAGGNEMINSLKKWVEIEGVSKFSKKEYAEKWKNKTPQEIKNAIAWGIVHNLKLAPRTRKRTWWNKGKTKDLEEFYDVLLKLISEEFLKEFTNSINTQ